MILRCFRRRSSESTKGCKSERTQPRGRLRGPGCVGGLGSGPAAAYVGRRALSTCPGQTVPAERQPNTRFPGRAPIRANRRDLPGMSVALDRFERAGRVAGAPPAAVDVGEQGAVLLNGRCTGFGARGPLAGERHARGIGGAGGGGRGPPALLGPGGPGLLPPLGGPLVGERVCVSSSALPLRGGANGRV